jgi:uncharacterized protein YjbJ (UPF0337 family)
MRYPADVLTGDWMSTVRTRRRSAMSGADKARNQAQGLLGKVKTAFGRLTGDRAIENRGRGDQTKSDLKGAGEKAKDAFKKP